MSKHYRERWFKISSPVEGVVFVVVGRDDLGWKMDVHGYELSDRPDGDTYQDSIDELLPFLGRYADAESDWSDYDTGEKLTMWDALTSVTGDLSN